MELLRTSNNISMLNLTPGVSELIMRQVMISHLNNLPLEFLKELCEFQLIDPRDPELIEIAKKDTHLFFLLEELDRTKSVRMQCKTTIP